MYIYIILVTDTLLKVNHGRLSQVSKACSLLEDNYFIKISLT